jgi:hypothetical protein
MYVTSHTWSCRRQHVAFDVTTCSSHVTTAFHVPLRCVFLQLVPSKSCLNFTVSFILCRECLSVRLSKEHYLYRVFPGVGHVFVTVSVGFQFWACRMAIQTHMVGDFLRPWCRDHFTQLLTAMLNQKETKEERKTYSYHKSQLDALFLNFILVNKVEK